MFYYGANMALTSEQKRLLWDLQTLLTKHGAMLCFDEDGVVLLYRDKPIYAEWISGSSIGKAFAGGIGPDCRFTQSDIDVEL